MLYPLTFAFSILDILFLNEQLREDKISWTKDLINGMLKNIRRRGLFMMKVLFNQS